MGNCCAADDDKNMTKTDVGKRSPKKRTKKGKGLSPEGFQEFKDEVQKEDVEQLWSDVEDFDEGDETDEDEFPTNEVSLDKKGDTKFLFRKEFMKKVIKYCAKDVKEKFKEIGPFKYRYGRGIFNRPKSCFQNKYILLFISHYFLQS